MKILLTAATALLVTAFTAGTASAETIGDNSLTRSVEPVNGFTIARVDALPRLGLGWGVVVGDPASGGAHIRK